MPEVASLLQSYGPVGFGAILALAFWIVVVRPELAASRTSTKSVEIATTQLATALSSVERISTTQQATAVILDRCVSRLFSTAFEPPKSPT